MRLSATIRRVEAPLRAGDGQADRGGLERGPDAAAQGRGGHPPVRGRGGLGRVSGAFWASKTAHLVVEEPDDVEAPGEAHQR